MTQLLDVLKAVARFIQSWLTIASNVSSLKETTTACSDAISVLGNQVGDLSNKIETMNTYGTAGSQKSFEKMHEKLDDHTERLIRVETIVLNGSKKKQEITSG